MNAPSQLGKRHDFTFTPRVVPRYEAARRQGSIRRFKRPQQDRKHKLGLHGESRTLQLRLSASFWKLKLSGFFRNGAAMERVASLERGGAFGKLGRTCCSQKVDCLATWVLPPGHVFARLAALDQTPTADWGHTSQSKTPLNAFCRLH